jgi:hypothetical protein
VQNTERISPSVQRILQNGYKNFDYILDSVKDDLQSYSNFRKCIEAEEKLSAALRYVLVIVVRININYF